MPKVTLKHTAERFKRIKARKRVRNLMRELVRQVKKAKAAKKAKNANVQAKSVNMTSFTDATKTYTVTAHSCTCPDFKFRRKARGESCKHMRAFAQNASN